MIQLFKRKPKTLGTALANARKKGATVWTVSSIGGFMVSSMSWNTINVVAYGPANAVWRAIEKCPAFQYAMTDSQGDWEWFRRCDPTFGVLEVYRADGKGRSVWYKPSN